MHSQIALYSLVLTRTGHHTLSTTRSNSTWLVRGETHSTTGERVNQPTEANIYPGGIWAKLRVNKEVPFRWQRKNMSKTDRECDILLLCHTIHATYLNVTWDFEILQAFLWILLISSSLPVNIFLVWLRSYCFLMMSTVIANIKEMSLLFYGISATVRCNRLWKVIHTSSFGTM